MSSDAGRPAGEPADEAADGQAVDPAQEPPARRRPRSARHQFASTILVLEAFVVLFAALAAYALRVGPGSLVWSVGGALVLALFLVAGLLRWPGGYVAGSVLQVVVLATGLFVTTMFVIGGIFVVLWFTGLRLGARIDRERFERLAGADGPEPAVGT